MRMRIHIVVYRNVSLLVVYQEVHHATRMLNFETIAQALTMGRIIGTVVKKYLQILAFYIQLVAGEPSLSVAFLRVKFIFLREN